MPEEVKEVNAEVLEQGEIVDNVIYTLITEERGQRDKYWVSGQVHRTKQAALMEISNCEWKKEDTKFWVIKIDLREAKYDKA